MSFKDVPALYIRRRLILAGIAAYLLGFAFLACVVAAAILLRR